MKYTAYVNVRRIYEAQIEADSYEEAKKKAEDMYGDGAIIEYEDELMDVDVFEENDGE